MRYKSAIAAAAFATAGFLALPTNLPAQAAQSAITPTYTCDSFGGDQATTRISGRCHASPGAVRNGEFKGTSVLASRLHRIRVRCHQGGKANVPHEVIGFSCRRI
jgi:hypothetical protein